MVAFYYHSEIKLINSFMRDRCVLSLLDSRNVYQGHGSFLDAMWPCCSQPWAAFQIFLLHTKIDFAGDG